MTDPKPTFKPEELLANLRGHSFLSNYQLDVFCFKNGNGSPPETGWKLCHSLLPADLCTRICQPAVEQALKSVVTSNQPAVFHCPLGLLNFAVPLNSCSAPLCCVIGGGVRERSLDLFKLETIARTEDINPMAILDQLQKLPAITEMELFRVAQKVHSLIPSFQKEEHHAVYVEKTTEQLNAIVQVSADIDAAVTSGEVVALLSETLGILFDVPTIAVALPEEGDRSFSLQRTWGDIPLDQTSISADKLRRLIPGFATDVIVLQGEDAEELVPGGMADVLTCIPLISASELFGLIFVFDRDLPTRDLLLTQIITGRVAGKLRQLQQQADYGKETSLSDKLMSIISSLALTEGQTELIRQVLEMGADLVNATSGSLMRIDDRGENLHIEAAIGMNLNLARSLNLKVGKGIAGRVALNGTPLLVNDIEKANLGQGVNRPRFKTKSFISLPLKFKEQVLGVLNLADKKDQGLFTEADLDLLTTFVEHAAAMIVRTLSLERAAVLEKLSLTDPLTELYNRRFLEKRMEEELNRSVRQGLSLTVMMIDLDHFKLYNDYNGHIAGDKALKKTAKILRNSVRDMDMVTRFGGEEFCIILPGTVKREAIFVAERVRRGIECEPFAGEEELPLGRLTTSIGLAAFPEDGDTATALIHAADVALYQAKTDGRNRITFSAPPQEKEVEHVQEATKSA